MTTIDRKYVLTKVAPGDYLLPSNNAEAIYRIVRYTDGPSNGLQIPHNRDFWEIRRWTSRGGGDAFVDTADWDCWECVESMHETRAEAIQAVLRR